MTDYDAVLVVSFGGPERPEDVAPFLANVTRGRPIPPERLAEVAAHYQAMGGVSPINARTRELVASVRARLAPMPVYWGNRNWDPLLEQAVEEMRVDGVRHALAFVTSAFGSYSGCRQYREDIERARASVAPDAPSVQPLRLYYDHPGFLDPMADRLRAGLSDLDRRLSGDPAMTRVVFTAHSIPLTMAAGSPYQRQLEQACALIAGAAAPGLAWDLVWQSRSGPPDVAWLEPDVNAHLATLRDEGVVRCVVVPVGFVSDHMEVVYDLDHEAAARAADLGLEWVRVPTVGADPRFVDLVAELVAEQTSGATARCVVPAAQRPLTCGPDCCPRPGPRVSGAPVR